VKLGMTDLPLTGEMEETLTQNIYPSRVNERCRLTVPSETRMLYLFTESPDDCTRLREQIIRVVRSMNRLHTSDMMDMAVESQLYRVTSLGSLGTQLSVDDDDGRNENSGNNTFIGFYDDCSMDRLRREIFSGVDKDVIEEKRRKLCEEIGIGIEGIQTDDDREMDSGKKDNVLVKKESSDHGEVDRGELVSCSGVVVLTEEVQL
jgi:hypothetical protein